MIDQFVELVREYLALIDGLPGIAPREFLLDCAILLPQIYSLSHQLPDVELPDDDSSEEREEEVESPMGKISNLLGDYDLYSIVFDPITDADALKTTLSDDLSDIYADLKRGLIKYDIGDKQDRDVAIWEWKFHMQIHWGQHAVGVLRPIHSLVYDHLDPEFRNDQQTPNKGTHRSLAACFTW